MIRGQDVAINHFQNGGRPPSRIFEIWYLVKRPVSNMIMLPHTKFCINRTINRWDVAINDFRYGGRLPFWICNFWYFITWPLLERESTSTHQISWKMDDSQLRYGDKPIFKMASVRHLEFMKFGILVMWPVSEHYSTFSYQILHQSDNKSLRYSQKKRFSIWRPSAILNSKILILCHVTVRRTRICVCIPNFIENGWLSAEI